MIIISRAKRITHEQEQQVIDLHGKMTAVEIAEMLGLNYNQVTDVYRRYNMTNKLEPIFSPTPLQHQILISGILGDGNIKQNGKNCYYRENHRPDQIEYLRWKHEQLKPMTRDSMVYYNPRARVPLWEFCTITSPTFNQYKNLSYFDIASMIDINGIFLFIMDDGWVSGNRHFMVSCGDKPLEVANALSESFNIHGLVGSHVIYQNKELGYYNISIPSSNNLYLNDVALNLIGNIDVYRAKFGRIHHMV